MPHVASVVDGPGCRECSFVTLAVILVEVGLLVQRVGKVVPLPSVVVDKLLDHILGSESLGGEDYKFEDISAEDIGPLNMMYGKISSVYQYLRKLIDELDFDEDYQYQSFSSSQSQF